MRETVLSDGEQNRAVSPVIGVILMVAITVILAAVIGAFVLEIGDQQETAPSTSYDTDQSMKFYENSSSDHSNLTTVEITHAGGDVNDISQTNIKVGGNGSWWGVETTNSGAADDAVPQPDLTQALGSNDAVQFSSGQSWNVVGGNNDSAVSDANLDATVNYKFGYTTSYEGVTLVDSNNGWWGGNNGELSVLEQGDTVNVVWTASSGGKTQNLFKYTVQ